MQRSEPQKSVSCLLASIVLCFAVALTGPLSYAQSSGDDIAVLKKELESLREECAQYRQANARLEKRLEQLENKIGSAQEKCLPPTVKEAAKQPASGSETPRSGQVSLISERNAFDQLPNYLTRGFEFSGYLRSGFGTNSKGGKMEAFQAPDSLGKYRLGNEQDTYLEAAFGQKNWNCDPNGVTIETQLRMVYQTQQNQDFNEDNKVLIREAYARMGNFVESDPGIKVWAGKRFYRMPELELNDFFWSDMSGYGGGLEDIDFFKLGKLHIAYLGFASGDLNISTSNGRIDKNNLNLMLDEVAVPGGKGTFWINGGYMRQGTFSGVAYPDAGGIDIGLMHQSQLKDTSNQFGMQYGYGANSSLSTGANIPLTGKERNSWRVRLTDMYNTKFTDRLSLQAVGLYQYTDNGSVSNYRETWASFGLRPVYGLTKHLALEIEPGFDYVENPRDSLNSYLLKFTTALRISPDASFESHPRFRLFVTYAQWGDNFKGHVGGGEAFADNANGINAGVQCEQWW